MVTKKQELKEVEKKINEMKIISEILITAIALILLILGITTLVYNTTESVKMITISNITITNSGCLVITWSDTYKVSSEICDTLKTDTSYQVVTKGTTFAPFYIEKITDVVELKDTKGIRSKTE